MMAIHIIGSTPDDAAALPELDVQLPGPETAPPATRPMRSETLEALLAHPEPRLRELASEQIRAYRRPELAEAVVGAIRDPDPGVSSMAVATIVDAQPEGAADAVATELREAQGGKAGALAAALGRLAPDRLLEAVKGRGRLDDDAYPMALNALAVVGGDEVRRFLEKALARVGLMSPERRRALFTAVLVAGDRALARRVIGEAVGDSNDEAPDGQSFPSRVAVASLGGLPGSASRLDAGDDIYDGVRKVLEEDVLSALAPEAREALESALAARRIGDSLRALEPLVDVKIPDDPEIEAEMGSLAARRQGLLGALVDRARDIGQLEPAAATLFLAAAAQAATLVVAATASEATSEAMTALARALDADPETVAAEDRAALAARLERLSPREMRRVHTLLTSQTFRRAATLKRVAGAVFLAGHGAGFISAIGESQNKDVGNLVLQVLDEVLEDAETAVLEVFDERPLDEDAAHFALAAADVLRTERVGLAVGQRFDELRKIEKGGVAEILLHVGDARALPLLEARAFPGEPEERAWALLARLHGQPEEGRVAEALERVRARRSGQGRLPLELQLECGRCGETCTYGFHRAYVDPEAEDDAADPALVGDVTCKACGAEDQLQPTPASKNVILQHLLELLQGLRTGELSSKPPVEPMFTEVEGKSLGMAAALRRLDELVAASPETIRLRLQRARLRLLLRRPGFDDDLQAAREQDPECVEATVLEGSRAVRDRQPSEGAALLSRAHAALTGDAPPRVYESASAGALRDQVEDLLLALKDAGEDIAADFDVPAARARRSQQRARDDAVQAKLLESAGANARRAD
jgi:hypothetical protein